MQKFVIATLAATALVPAAALAQAGHGASHSNAGVSWQNRAGGHHQMMRQHHGNRQVTMHRRAGEHRMGGGHHVMPRHHGFNRHHNYKRIDRGFIVPQFWWGPRFHIQNWNTYGFAQPMHGRRWVRYYDDALLIDHAGRVHDGRWGMRWDNWADQWAYDDQGIPYYDEYEDEGGDYSPTDEDYAWLEEEDGAYADHGVPPPPPPPCATACAPSMPGYGHGYSYAYPGYGYGWMHGGMVTITETTVHAAAPQTVTETVYIEKPVKTKPRRSYKRAKPRPLPGERG